MFFLAVLVWATLTTEPPKIVKVYRTLDECMVAASKNNSTAFGVAPPKTKFICLEVRGDA